MTPPRSRSSNAASESFESDPGCVEESYFESFESDPGCVEESYFELF
jgi:hypothetical protein